MGRHGFPLAALLVAVVAALAVLPARWLMRLGDDQAMVAIVDASGTIWNGAALLALGPPGARRTLPQPLSWHWTWQGVVLRHPWLGGDVRLSPAWRGLATPSLSLSGQTLSLPADMLAALGAPLNTLAPGGSLALSWPDYEAGVTRAPTLWQLEWRDASSALSSVRPLGSYRLQATAADGKGAKAGARGGAIGGATGGVINLTLGTLSGPLRVQATGTWDGRKLDLHGTAEAAAGSPENVREGLDALLSALGRRSGGQSIFGTR
ncbi:general secretion pathway protein GspN [Achromobacter aloeverae]|uniref:General secretion pathway protein GspN n=1 Tax=Achromobacter aloeverae TaxID=1750518 RepID=A0A4Q1HDJ5_9BURK|nr:general secretion pathway protein GspN [Achromobacter aloeverae]